MNNRTSYTDFPEDLEEASRRFEGALWEDPLPSIAPALLNSSDIEAYVKQVGLIYDFDSSRLKSATYTARAGSVAVRWETDNANTNEPQTCIHKLSDDGLLKVSPFSLVYITSHEMFLLPQYIAARFNFRIEYVHRGLLLGTGPIVDPGFKGRLLIPVHNLTSNTYWIRPEDYLIDVEFTKTSPIPEWAVPNSNCANPGERGGEIKPFPRKEWDRSVDYYVNRACRGQHGKAGYREIAHAAPQQIDIAVKMAGTAKSTVDNTRRLFYRFGVGGFVVGAIALFSLVLSSWYLVTGSVDRDQRLNDSIVRLSDRVKVIETNDIPERIDRIEDDLDARDAQARNRELGRRLDKLAERVDLIENRYDSR